ncbi:hypothetical protein CHELA20_53949 [Hyphomicrobiales bacterium]|nr:hypothetical protein CHELA41_20978 [Hyphomicrobiales bacterium]CAH1685286.1 hypothetical protein CHELA20_53949 [Hyphomicrobiales bacterium]
MEWKIPWIAASTPDEAPVCVYHLPAIGYQGRSWLPPAINEIVGSRNVDLILKPSPVGSALGASYAMFRGGVFSGGRVRLLSPAMQRFRDGLHP